MANFQQELFKLIKLDKENSVIGESSHTKLFLYLKIQLPVFDGDIKNWLGFCGQFQKINKHPDLDTHNKFAYLFQTKEKGSVAVEFVKIFLPGA